MKISQREDFGLIVMNCFASHYKEGFVSIANAAKETGLSPLFLKHIVSRLLKHKLVESREGIGGGYRLSRSPDKITVETILRAISGGDIVQYCNKKKCRISKKKCICIPFWHKFNRKVRSYLSTITLSDFAYS